MLSWMFSARQTPLVPCVSRPDRIARMARMARAARMAPMARMHRLIIAAIVAPLVAAACRSTAISQTAAQAGSSVARGGDASYAGATSACAEQYRQFSKNPNIPAEWGARPLAGNPSPYAKTWKVSGSGTARTVSGGNISTVVVRFVVDTTGIPDMATYNVVTAERGFPDSEVREVIMKWRFQPAGLPGACKVKQLYTQTFYFPRGR